jgi:hypothetical protein
MALVEPPEDLFGFSGSLLLKLGPGTPSAY